jgi:hypothetical protein
MASNVSRLSRLKRDVTEIARICASSLVPVSMSAFCRYGQSDRICGSLDEPLISFFTQQGRSCTPICVLGSTHEYSLITCTADFRHYSLTRHNPNQTIDAVLVVEPPHHAQLRRESHSHGITEHEAHFCNKIGTTHTYFLFLSPSSSFGGPCQNASFTTQAALAAGIDIIRCKLASKIETMDFSIVFAFQ